MINEGYLGIVESGLQTYYLHMSRDLLGYYVLFKANDAETVKAYARENFGKMWSSICTEAFFKRHIKRDYAVINADRPIVLQ